jgi:hypothetical protein
MSTRCRPSHYWNRTRSKPVQPARNWLPCAPMLVALIGIMCIPSLLVAWCYDAKLPENMACRDLPDAKRYGYRLMYFGLTAFLALMTYELHLLLRHGSLQGHAPLKRSPVHGLNVGTPVGINPSTSRVAMQAPFSSAIAAISTSTGGLDCRLACTNNRSWCHRTKAPSLASSIRP